MQRPTSVTVFGILNIVFGALALICTPFSLAFLFVPNPAMETPAMAAFANPAYRAWTLAMGVAGMGVSVLLIVAGIGLLKCRPWGRKISIGYAVYTIVASLVGAAVSAIMLASVANSASGGSPETGVMLAGGIGGTIGGACFALIYPIILLVFMFRPSVVDACSGVVYAPAEPPALNNSFGQ